MAALNPRGAKMFFPNEIAGFINFSKNLAIIDPKAPPSQLFLLVYLFVSVLRTIHEVNQLC